MADQTGLPQEESAREQETASASSSGSGLQPASEAFYRYPPFRLEKANSYR